MLRVEDQRRNSFGQIEKVEISGSRFLIGNRQRYLQLQQQSFYCQMPFKKNIYYTIYKKALQTFLLQEYR